jgi:RHS repeat-associated protein
VWPVPGLHPCYGGQRYEDLAIGAFTQQDSSQILANPSNGNLYAYAGDNPSDNTDPSGFKTAISGCWSNCCWLAQVQATERADDGAFAGTGGRVTGLTYLAITGSEIAGPGCGVSFVAVGAGAFAGYNVDYAWTHFTRNDNAKRRNQY